MTLDGKTSVEFDGESLAAETTPAARKKVRYRRKRANLSAREVWGNHQFKFVDSGGNPRKVDVTLPTLPTLTLSSMAVTLNDPITVTWTTSEALGSDELYLLRNPDNVESTEFREDVPAAGPEAATGTFIIPEARIRSWGAAIHKLQLCRARVTKPENTPKAGGSLQMTVCTSALRLAVTN